MEAKIVVRKDIVTGNCAVVAKIRRPKQWLPNTYTQPAAVPPMPWVSSKSPASPGISALLKGNATTVTWHPDGNTAKIAVQGRIHGAWQTVKIVPSGAKSLTIPRADAIAVTALDRFGNASAPKVLGLK